MKFNTKRLIVSGVLMAFGLVIPMAFHGAGMAGPIFLPMHIPVLVGGFILSPLYALFVGMFTPVLSSFLTGMPPAFPILPIMIFELGLYGWSISVLKRKTSLNQFSILVLGMVAGRLGAGAIVGLLASGFGLKMNPMIYLQGAVANGLPGIVLQMIFIPPLMKAVERAGFVSDQKAQV
ncbi:ECF transporter S component [Fusibacter sp. JL216-2]|uniref:ECF transporter S component n=1 Tax=Fusibacter sp. JL216-2 TaxID=3071453 RepID=UPI003D33478D